MEKTNFRYVTSEQVPEAIDFASADVAFISLKLILGPAYALLRDGACMVCLIKPQFEAGREKVGKKGVVRDKSVHKEVIGEIAAFAQETGFVIRGLDHSPIKGPEGNIEYLLYLQKNADQTEILSETVIDDIVEKAFRELDTGGSK
jgi:23S rRNA (cytidine1920-2'-O)/16S rRNA (cytidine1409-2'-O)-methyltransferase